MSEGILMQIRCFCYSRGQDLVFPGMEIKHPRKRCDADGLPFARCHFPVRASALGQAGYEELEQKYLS